METEQNEGWTGKGTDKYGMVKGGERQSDRKGKDKNRR